MRAVNLVLLFPDDFVTETHARVDGRRFAQINRLSSDDLAAGVANGRLGRARVVGRHSESAELEVQLDRDPPPPLPLNLVLALPRPKVLNRVIAGAASMGIKRIFLINAWKVEKSYWKSPRISPENLREQCVLGLEQARDTILPEVSLHRFFRPFVEKELPAIAERTLALVAHPPAADPCPRDARGSVTLAIGPEGGFIDAEIALLERIGFRAVSLGPRILRVETAVAAAAGRLMNFEFRISNSE